MQLQVVFLKELAGQWYCEYCNVRKVCFLLQLLVRDVDEQPAQYAFLILCGCAGSPTLGGHMPTQVSKALGSIITTEANKTLPCGVYGSFGWSGEAVDKLHERLNDAGFQHAFKPIKVKFRPTAKDLQVHSWTHIMHDPVVDLSGQERVRIHSSAQCVARVWNMHLIGLLAPGQCIHSQYVHRLQGAPC